VLHAKYGGVDRPRKVLCDLDLDLRSVEDTLVCISDRGLPTHQIRSKLENFLWTYGWPDTPEFQSIRSSPGNDLTEIILAPITMFLVLSVCHHGDATARVHPVHLMNADGASDGRQPSNQTNQLGM